MKIYELFSDESKWTTKAGARKADGSPTDVNCNEAVCWCLAGAVMRCYPVQDCGAVLSTIQDSIGRRIPEFNDDPNTTFADIKALVTELDV